MSPARRAAGRLLPDLVSASWAGLPARSIRAGRMAGSHQRDLGISSARVAFVCYNVCEAARREALAPGATRGDMAVAVFGHPRYVLTAPFGWRTVVWTPNPDFRCLGRVGAALLSAGLLSTSPVADDARMARQPPKSVFSSSPVDWYRIRMHGTASQAGVPWWRTYTVGDRMPSPVLCGEGLCRLPVPVRRCT